MMSLVRPAARFLTRVAAIFLLAMVAINVIDVGLRSVLNAPIFGTHEIVVFMLSAVAFFSGFTKYMGGLKIKEVPLSDSADSEMRSLAKKVMDKRIAGMEKNGLPARKVYEEMKALAAKYSK